MIKHITFLLAALTSTMFVLGQEKCKEQEYPKSALLLSEYVSIPSVSGEEYNAGFFLSSVCRDRGLNVEIFTEDSSSYNFAASLYPLDQEKPNVIFLNHIDVVSVGCEHEWTHDPFSGIICDDKIWGRGAIDNKGMAIMQLEAISGFIELSKREELPYNVTLLSVSSEELGGHLGAEIVVDKFLERLNPIVVFGEGGAGLSGVISSDPNKVLYGISVAQKRGLWLRLTLHMETSGHGSVPPKEYVNKEMIAALNRLNSKNQKIVFTETTRDMFKKLGDLEKGPKGFVLKNISLFKPLVAKSLKKEELISTLVTNSVTLTNISNPKASSNIISQEIEAVLDCRLLPGTDTEKFIGEVKKSLKDERIKIEIINESERAHASKTDAYYDMMEKAIKRNDPMAEVAPILFPAFNDNSYFRSKGIASFGILPVEMERGDMHCIHNVNERLSISSLNKGIETYSEFIHLLFLPYLNTDFITRAE